MSAYNEMIDETVATDAGDYTIVAHVHDDGCCDESINLYVGKAADGHHDLIASDNASMWVVGDREDAGRNRDQWVEILERCPNIAPLLAEVRKIDADLADWLDDRYQEANAALVIVERRDYDNGILGWSKVVSCSSHLKDVYDAISEHWDDIDVDDVIIRGVGDCEEVLHLAAVTGDTRTIDGLGDLSAPYYVASYDRETGDGDCGDWEYYSADGRHLTDEDEIFAHANA